MLLIPSSLIFFFSHPVQWFHIFITLLKGMIFIESSNCDLLAFLSPSAAASHRQRLNQDLTKRGYDIEHNRYPEGYQEAPLAYDAVWSVALAFNKTMERLKVKSRSLKDFTYTDKDIADEIYAAMNSTQFLGVSVSEKIAYVLCSIKITINSHRAFTLSLRLHLAILGH